MKLELCGFVHSQSIDSMLPLLAMYKIIEIVMINKMKITTAPSTANRLE